MIDTHCKFLDSTPNFLGLNIDIDEISKSPAYDTGKVESYSLKKLRDAAWYLKDWKRRLQPVRRGSFVARFNKDSTSEMFSRPELLATMDSAERTLFQVFSQPYFTPADFERRHYRHLTTGAFIPAAAMAARIFNKEHVLESDGYQAKEIHDWSYEFVNDSTDNTITLSRSDLEGGRLDKIINALESTDQIIVWKDVKKSFKIDLKKKRTLVPFDSKDDQAIDLVFSARIRTTAVVIDFSSFSSRSSCRLSRHLRKVSRPTPSPC